MKFFKNLLDLQQFNLCRNEECYCEPFFVQEDIIFQIELPQQSLNDYTFQIDLLSPDGQTLLEDITSYFDALFAVGIKGNKYANFKMNSKNQLTEDCFLLRLKIQNKGILIFDKFSEKYCKKNGNIICYAQFAELDFITALQNGISINGNIYSSIQDLNSAGFVVDYSNLFINIFLNSCTDEVVVRDVEFEILNILDLKGSNCEFPYIKVCSLFDCYDNIGQYYYGDFHTLLNYQNNVTTLKYNNCQYLPAFIERLPTDLKTTISKNNRLTRVEYLPIYEFKALIAFPKWKQNELENLFSGKEVYLNGDTFKATGGAVLEKDAIACSCSFLLKTKLTKNLKVNNLNCDTDCKKYCYYYVVKGLQKNQAYYSENGTFIGYLFQELLDYLIAYSQTISVAEIVNTCNAVAVIKVDSTGYVPSYFYHTFVAASNRVFVKKDDCENPNLCSTGCPAPIVELGNYYLDVCQSGTIILGVQYEELANTCTIVSSMLWQLNGASSVSSNTSQIYLDVNMFNSSLNSGNTEQLLNELVFTLQAPCRPCQPQLIDLGNGNSLLVQTNGNSYISGNFPTTLTGMQIVLPNLTINKNC